MKTVKTLLLAFLIVGCCTLDCNAQKSIPFGYHINSIFNKSTTIPFEFKANLMVVQLSIDNSPKLNFILDTGVSGMVFTDPIMAKKLNLETVRTLKIYGIGEEEPLNAGISIGHSIKLGDLEAKRMNVIVIEKDILKFSEHLGIPIHGIFGYDIFKRFVVNINFLSRYIKVIEPKKFKYKKRYGHRYPITVTKSKPYTEAMAIATNTKTNEAVRLVIDTGAGHALLLNSDTQELPAKVIRTNLGRGLGGDINGNLGRVSSLKFGTNELNGVITSFPDSISFNSKIDAQRDGSIGGELLRRFNVTLNYTEGYIALNPIKKFFKEPFEHDMAGIQVRARGEDFASIYISEVDKGSPAEQAGLLPNDELILINDLNITTLDLGDINRIFSEKAGKEVQLLVRRSGQLKLFSFKLKRII